jgi:hypothetical protein
MANFLITSPNTTNQGTDTTDLFVLNTALGSTLIAGGGADIISAAAATQFTNANFQGGAGGDSIFFTGNGASQASVPQFLLGNGADILLASALSITVGTVIGGGGNDTISFQAGGIYTDSRFNGNANSDLILVSGGTLLRSTLAGGGDNDTFNLQLNASDAVTLLGGGGNDVITVSGGNFSGGRIEGDQLGSDSFAGNDTITFSNITASLVQGGVGDDVLINPARLATAVSVEGGAGNDVVNLSAPLFSGQIFAGGGAGTDTISVSGALAANFGTIVGGGGADLINVSAATIVSGGGQIIGGDAADAIGLGISGFTTTTGHAGGATGVAVSYQNFGQSNLDALDVISAAPAAGAGGTTAFAFQVTQSAVNFAAVAVGTFGAAGNQFAVTTGQRVASATFAAGTTSLTQRTVSLDAGLGAGAAVLFEVGNARYLFVQGGAAGSGTANDLVAELNVGGFAASGAGIVFTNNSAIQIKSTSNTNF